VKKTQQRGDRRRELIADAALAELDESGIAAITHRAVAERAGVPAASLAHYFPTSESLVEAALDRMVDRELDQFAALGERLSPRDEPSEVLGHALADALLALVRHAGNAQLAQFEALVHLARNPAGSGTAARWMHAYEELAERLLADAGVPEPRVAAGVIVPAIFGLVLLNLAEQPDEQALRDACARLIAGLRSSG
jgi:AcrR family transcriptional regulator